MPARMARKCHRGKLIVGRRDQHRVNVGLAEQLRQRSIHTDTVGQGADVTPSRNVRVGTRDQPELFGAHHPLRQRPTVTAASDQSDP